MTPRPKLHWRGSGPRREVYDDVGQLALVLRLDNTPEGPRWFVDAGPSGGSGNVAGPCDTFGEAARRGLEWLGDPNGR